MSDSDLNKDGVTDISEAVVGGPEFIAQQQAQAAAEAEAERQRVADLEAANPTVPTADKFREAGGYLLMDPQWTLGLDADMSDPNTPEGRTAYVESKLAAGEMAAWEDGGLNPLPLSNLGVDHLQAAADRREEGLRMGLDAAMYGLQSTVVTSSWVTEPGST